MPHPLPRHRPPGLLRRLWEAVMATKRTTRWMADFETTTHPAYVQEGRTRVWSWGLADIDRAETLWDVETGTDLDGFFARCAKLSPAQVYFHNLGFDGYFILDRLLRMGYRHTTSRSMRRGEFATLISDMGKFYSITVVWENGRKTEYRDSLKKLPFSLAVVASSFGLPEAKGSIDYDAPRPVGHQLTREERKYLATDVLIGAKALRTQFQAGMTKLTVGADALAEFKRTLGKDVFDTLFPILPATMDAEIRAAYRGGWTYRDPRTAAATVGVTGGGKVYDVNSLYPSVMYDRVLPYGEPAWFDGPPSPTKERPLYITSVTFTAKLKPGHVPCIQVKGTSIFAATEYQEVIREPVTLMASSVDLALWADHYDLDILAWGGGWAFQGVSGLFTDYIEKWMEVKANSEGGMRTLAKLLLNSLYGKFGTNPNVTGKLPVLDPEGDAVKLVMGAEELRDPVYSAMAVFITAYARDVTVRAAQANYASFAYADTDSLHLLLPPGEEPVGIEVHKSRLGAWKFEYAFDSAMYVRAKAYVEHLPYPDCGQDQVPDHVHTEHCHYVTHVAGLPDRVAEQVTFRDVFEGNVFHGKLVPKKVPGGVVLEDVGFTLHL